MNIRGPISKNPGGRVPTIVYFNVPAVKPEFGATPDWRSLGSTPAADDHFRHRKSFCSIRLARLGRMSVCLCRYPIDGIFFDGPCLFANCATATTAGSSTTGARA